LKYLRLSATLANDIIYKMKRTVWAVLLMFLALIVVAQPKPNIAVLDFKTSGVSEREMRVIISMISNSLFKTGKFTVIDVEQREALLKEIEFSNSDCVDEACQLKIGKQLSAELIVVGVIDKVGSRLILASKVLEIHSARTVSVADGVYRDLDELVNNIENLGRELAELTPTADKSKPVSENISNDSVKIRRPAPPGFVLVEAGSFPRGSTSGENNEQPVHSVTISRGFYMSRYEATQRQWREVMGTDPSHFKGDDLPVENVSWHEAVEYCNRLSRKEGLTPCYSGSADEITCDFSANGCRLPTEGEWEYAARGGNQSKGYTYAGSNAPGEVGWYAENSGRTTHPVGQKRPNELGLNDMSGNVWEWCWDFHGEYSAASATDPRGPKGGSLRVSRGGSWVSAAGFLRSARRNRSTPAYRDWRGYLGFRPVRTAE